MRDSRHQPVRSRRVVALALAPGILVGLLVVYRLGPARTCNLTPPCPAGQFCTFMLRMGPCPVTLLDLGVVLVAVIAVAGLIGSVMLLGAHVRNHPGRTP